jgi:hypothetical protein
MYYLLLADYSTFIHIIDDLACLGEYASMLGPYEWPFFNIAVDGCHAFA